ncbi:TolC family protein [Actimicrobium antarcticum]|uniref:TolC family protein n=2 Tax=Actimicrobium antarcticum TaxID=1051899 RepID=A0ABP7SSI6_9BURK
MRQLRKLKPLSLAVMTLVLSGCATFSQDGGLDSVASLTKERTGQTVQREKSADDIAATQATVSELLAKPLTADSAVQLALRNNKGLQASLADLGVAEADLVQSGRLRNPGFSFGRQRSGDDVEIDRSIMFDLAGLLTMPMRTKIEGRRFEQAKLQAASSAVELAADTRKAYFNAVAAAQSVTFAEQVRTAAEAGADMAQRLARVGNFSKLDQAREQVFYAEATTQLARALHNATATREELTRLMGIWGNDIGFKLPDRLPDLPKTANEAGDIEAQAMTRRLDVLMAKRDTEATASALGLTRATAFVNVLDAGYTSKSVSGSPRANGYQIELVLPIFDWGTARSAKAESLYMQAVHRTADTAVRARSQVREAYSAYRTSYDIARHYRDDVVPLRKMISDEVMLRYNGMLASVFELLSDARDQVNSVNGAIEAQRDFWISETELQAVIHGSGAAPSRSSVRNTPSASAPSH